MDVVILLVFLGVALVSGAVGFYVWTVRQGSLDHADRLSLLPLDDRERPVEHHKKEIA